MRRKLLLLIIVLQIAVMASVVVKREQLLATDNTVVLRTAPVDPRDPFRGDFVILDYEANEVPYEFVEPLLVEEDGERFRRVFAALTADKNGLSSVARLGLEPPESGPFLRGSVGSGRSWSEPGTIRVKYGVEKLFVEQGRGLEMETRVGERDEWQQPMEVTLGVASDGTAGIKSWRWSDVAFRLQVVAAANRRPEDELTEERNRLSPVVSFSIQNRGSEPLVFFDSAERCNFSLLGHNRAKLSLLNPPCDETTKTNRLVLQPEQIHQWEFDLSEPRWHVKGDDVEGEIGMLGPWSRFRLAYVPPNDSNLDNEPVRTWDSVLYSRSFTNGGGVD